MRLDMSVCIGALALGFMTKLGQCVFENIADNSDNQMTLKDSNGTSQSENLACKVGGRPNVGFNAYGGEVEIKESVEQQRHEESEASEIANRTISPDAPAEFDSRCAPFDLSLPQCGSCKVQLQSQCPELEVTLGSGNFGRVFKGRFTKDNGDVILVAVKELDLNKDRIGAQEIEERRELAMAETLAMEAIQGNPNSLLMYGHVEREGKYYIVMEFANNGTLADLIDTGELSMDSIRSLSSELVHSVVDLHIAGWAHLDIKPQNILVFKSQTNEITLKLADLGLALPLTDLLDEACGAGGWNAPETEIAPFGAITKADSWSMGAVIYELLGLRRRLGGLFSGQQFAYELNIFRIREFDALALSMGSDQDKEMTSVGLALLADHLLVVDPENRDSPAQAATHPFMMPRVV